MTKQSKVQNKALLTAIQNERRAHVRNYADRSDYRNAQLRNNISQSTLQSLVKKGMYEYANNNDNNTLQFTDTGRKVAIDLLHEGAADEMADELHYRDMEVKRKQAGADVAAKIIERYDVGMVEVIADYRLRDNALKYSIGFPQEQSCSYSSSLVSIDFAYDEYAIQTTGTHLTPKDAKRMAELMLIAVQIIESGILS